ncbi:hypothetical protein NKOR_04870 [Candidatus Nitrosopumilus koreensis AR1]|uniref:SHOCT domain-containing protein n=1 Tax=Candidatus Nitrosopumilus koreensis AR1 TaxID=1229908 RepID=K0B7C9_9ARCH|nr:MULTISPECIES: hypothetical protein [Nitrosopumilus]AFS80860.1 hypothetical protein NKOR_04870 [Candidatus Nitrosopumilus koreensis AR1]
MRKPVNIAIMLVLFSIITALNIDQSFADSIDNLADFVDPNKDPQYYLDRYYNEPKYKSWFDKNYPDITIEAAVGINNEENTIDSILEKKIIQEADAALVHQDTTQKNNSETAQMILAIGGLGILFGAVYGVKKKVNDNTRQISINKETIKNRIIKPITRSNPLEIIQIRLAKGEITIEEFERLESKLSKNTR